MLDGELMPSYYIQVLVSFRKYFDCRDVLHENLLGGSKIESFKDCVTIESIIYFAERRSIVVDLEVNKNWVNYMKLSTLYFIINSWKFSDDISG